ncbi:hypothetical protein BSLG_008573 [Batrachochytrium salamandrivorans]|nr:hypothetical protein BSLG_008573 [Batrachochytrium salamandrivorans]
MPADQSSSATKGDTNVLRVVHSEAAPPNKTAGSPPRRQNSADTVHLWSSFFLSNWFYVWVFPIVARASSSSAAAFAKIKLQLRPDESARLNTDKLEAEWLKMYAASPSEAKFLNALYTTYGLEYGLIGLYKIAWTVFTWAGAWYLLKLMLIFLSGNEPLLNGHMYAMALFLSSFLIYYHPSAVSRLKGGAGEVINILSTDVTRINDAVVNFHFLWAAFVEVLLILIISFYEIDGCHYGRVHLMSEILTAIKLIKFYAWEAPFTDKIEEIRRREMKLIYDGLIVKTVNFAVVFAVPVLVALTCLATYVATGHALTASVSFTILSVFNTLRYPFFMLPMAVKATTGALTAFGRLEDFLHLDEVDELKVTDAPAGSDLALEIVDSDFKWDGAEGDAPSLRNISLAIKRGARVAIVGDVGSGKSSLIAALLGQIRQVRGPEIKLYNSTAYMSQEAWILNLTLRNNILFGKDMDMARYQEVIRVAGLQRDLTLLLAADQTEIAERGANLSGGQRQRVSLARTIYYDADIVILDDPLSAVDQHVGRHIFEECFLKHLGKKTLIVALNQLQYLSQMDYVIFVDDGTIRGQGTYAHLMENDSVFSELVNSHVLDGGQADADDEDFGDVPLNNKEFEIAPIVVTKATPPHADDGSQWSFRHLRNQLSSRNWRDLNENTIRSVIDKQNASLIIGAERSHDIAKITAQNELSVYSLSQARQPHMATQEEIDNEDDDAILRGKLVQDDVSAQATGFGDFVAYARSGSGSTVTISIMIFFIAVHGIRIGGDYWLRLWVPRVGGFSDAVYVGVYGVFAVAFTIGAFLRGLVFSQATSYKASALHSKLFHAVMHAPMSFFDMTPLGRILSAFSKHQLHVDDTMLDAAIQALQYFPLGLGALVLCAAIIPFGWAPAIGVVFIAYLLIRYSNPADLKTKSLEAITKPPIYAHLTATLEGLFSVRAYHAQSRFDSMNLERIDNNHEALFAMQCVKSFQALYLDILSSIFIYFAALLLVLRRSDPSISSVGGLALSNALQMLVFVQWTVRMWGEVETQMSSVGQLVYYGSTKPEAPFEIPDKKPPSDWPTKGLINFNNIVLKYQKFGVAVLKNVSCTIYPTEKIGIVGRTGSGKSTLLVSLLRIVESSEGKITIDGVDVSQIGLHDLRNKVAIIPQEPVMFVGTLRSNLDPFSRSTDEEIWKALDSVQLGEKVRAMPSRLETVVTENGKSVSQGQRQLICIARAILSKAKILVLDEATASLDAKTDLLIQETIKKNFADLTMLTIAHRLNTIIDCDRVLVMDAGKVVEFDEPSKLLNIPDGIFRSLVEQTGEASAAKLREVAESAYAERAARGYSIPDRSMDSGPMTVSELAAAASGGKTA